MLSYDLTPAAEADLEEIARYTTLEWGPEQATRYIDKLHECFQKIAKKRVIGKTFSKRFPNVSVTRCEHHYMFYLHVKQTKPVIIAVLHERMDMLARLKDRLS